MTGQAPAPRALFVSWAELRRADTIAARLGVPSVAVKWLRRGGPRALTLLRYLLQAAHTFLLLLRRRPRVVLVTSPPVFAVLPVWLYCVLSRARYAIDHHSGCFLDAHWRRWEGLQRFLARRAALNLIHNPDNLKAAEGWGARTLVFPSLPPDIEGIAGRVGPAGPPPRSGPQPDGPPDRPRVVYICSFKDDEPVDALLAAASGLPEAEVLVTGRAPEGVAARLPPNVRLTGFLSEAEYDRLLAGADLIVALTTRAGTLLYGAQEAIALGKPLLLSRMPTLEACFAGGAVFAENTAEGLRAGIREALARRAELAAAMGAFAERYRAEGAERLERLRASLGLPAPAPARAGPVLAE